MPMAKVYLAVETEPMLAMLREYLAAMGHEVVGGTTQLSRAFEEIRASSVSLDTIVLDLPLEPERLLKTIAQLRGLGARSRIVVISSEFRLAARAIGAGADKFLERPFELALLLRALQGEPHAGASPPARGEQGLVESYPL